MNLEIFPPPLGGGKLPSPQNGDSFLPLPPVPMWTTTMTV